MNQPIPPLPDAWIFLAGLLLGIGFWSLVVSLISIIGGWHSLAKTYRTEETTFPIASESEGKRFRWASMSMGPTYFPTNYGNCLNVTIDERGIGVKVFPIFRLMHPPLFLLWSDVESCELDKVFLVYPRATVRLRGRGQSIRFTGKCASEIDRVWSRVHSIGSEDASQADYGRTFEV